MAGAKRGEWAGGGGEGGRKARKMGKACGGGYVFSVVDLLLSGTFFLGVC